MSARNAILSIRFYGFILLYPWYKVKQNQINPAIYLLCLNKVYDNMNEKTKEED